MKVLFITDTMHPGGSERVISVLANQLSCKDIDTGIVCFRGDNSFYQLDDKVSVYYAAVETNKATILKRGRWLRHFCLKERPDVVIPFMTAVYCLTIFSLLGTNIPIIASERIDPTTTPWKRKILRWALLRFVTHLVVQTESIKSYYSRSLQRRCTVIYNPVDDSFFDLPDVVREMRFINVGRLSAQKNQRMLIDAFASISQDYPDFSLSIYGEGEQEEELKQYIAKKGMSGRVTLKGTSNCMSRELNRSYAFCLSSNFEGMSNAVLEAVCVGTPVITTEVSGIRELITDQVNGFIVPINNGDAFAKAMRKLASDAGLADMMRENNKEKGREMFRTDSIVSQWLNVINTVVG